MYKKVISVVIAPDPSLELETVVCPDPTLVVGSRVFPNDNQFTVSIREFPTEQVVNRVPIPMYRDRLAHLANISTAYSWGEVIAPITTVIHPVLGDCIYAPVMLPVGLTVGSECGTITGTLLEESAEGIIQIAATSVSTGMVVRTPIYLIEINSPPSNDCGGL